MDTLVLVGIFVATIFAVDAANRWWRENRWRYRRRDDDGPT
jgi:hypothetical protein